ncbi:MAG: polysaccharide biosynthesis protein [Actinomycetota bacterium]
MAIRGASLRRSDRADHELTGFVYRLARRFDSIGLQLLDAGAIGGAWLLAGLAGFDQRADAAVLHYLIWFVGLPVVISLVVNHAAGLYGPVWRYASNDEAVRVIVAVAVGTTLSTVGTSVIASRQAVGLSPLAVASIAALGTFVGVGGVRFQSRFFAIERQRTRKPRLNDGETSRALIVGAGDAGASLAYELSRLDASNRTEIVGFVDDERRLAGRSIYGIPILGPSADLPSICKAHDIDMILVALGDTNERKEVLSHALAADAQVKVLSPASERVAGHLLGSLRDLDLTDLLGRPHAPVDSAEIATYLAGATVLVTGAGGSIGSEVVRQVAGYGPGRLVVLDREETLLHEITVEVPNAEPVLADITDEDRLARVFAEFRPDVVFHIAAQKHVPMLEQFPLEAIRTNVLGTWLVAKAAAEHGCSKLILISTDKAAEPYSVMGATKRIAEQIVFEVGRRYDREFVAVRFGNVLGTRGSVVPTFLRQILEGGPVTVTSPEMTRFFMTVTESVSLVLQTGAMAHGRSIFLLDMGEPVPILGLARQMIRLAGLRPEQDVPISFVGLRPGERLHEQLHDAAEIVEPSTHPSIRLLVPRNSQAWERLPQDLDDLSAAIAAGDASAAVKLVREVLLDRGIPCHLDGWGREADAQLSLLDLTAEESAIDLPVRRIRPLALLGGRPAFPDGVPIARPARPPLEQVMRRLDRSYDAGMLTNGPLVAELEERAADRLGVPYVVAVSSCTSGLMLALQALVEGRTGPVVMPSFTFSATGLAASWNNRGLRFVGCDPGSFQIDPGGLIDALEGASALIATHVFGAPCRPAVVEQMARMADVPVMFDAAHGFGATSLGESIGGFGDVEVFSLTPTKILVAGEGGLVATRDPGLAERLRVGRNYGNDGSYNIAFPGLNARLSEFHAAMALESLEMLDASLRRRRQLAALYRRCFEAVPGISVQSIPLSDESTFKDFTIAVDSDTFGMGRDRLVEVLSAEGIETRNYFDPPLHRQTAFAGAEWGDDLSTVDRTSKSVVSLPVYPDIETSTIERIVEVIALAHENADQIACRPLADAPTSNEDVLPFLSSAAGA